MKRTPRPTPHRLIRRVAASGEQGAILIESLIAMVVIAIVCGSFATAGYAVSINVRNSHAHDVATQATHGLLEEALAASWSSLAFLPGDGPAMVGTAHTVRGEEAAFRSTESRTVNGRKVDLAVTVVWKRGSNTCASTCSPSEFGTKVVTASASWRAADGRTIRSVKRIERTADASEALRGTYTATPPVDINPVAAPPRTPDGTTPGDDTSEETNPGFENPPPACSPFTLRRSDADTVAVTWSDLGDTSVVSYRVTGWTEREFSYPLSDDQPRAANGRYGVEVSMPQAQDTTVEYAVDTFTAEYGWSECEPRLVDRPSEPLQCPTVEVTQTGTAVFEVRWLASTNQSMTGYRIYRGSTLIHTAARPASPGWQGIGDSPGATAVAYRVQPYNNAGELPCAPVLGD